MESLRQSAGIVLVLLLLWLAIWVLKRKGLAFAGGRWHSKTRHLECLERLAITPQHSLHLVRISGQLLVLGVSPSGISVLPVSAALTATPSEVVGS